MGIESKFVWMNGEFVDYENATVPFLNPALHYGFACFEGIRCYNTDKGPAIFRNKEHMQRLAESAHITGFKKLPFDVQELMNLFKGWLIIYAIIFELPTSQLMIGVMSDYPAWI